MRKWCLLDEPNGENQLLNHSATGKRSSITAITSQERFIHLWRSRNVNVSPGNELIAYSLALAQQKTAAHSSCLTAQIEGRKKKRMRMFWLQRGRSRHGGSRTLAHLTSALHNGCLPKPALPAPREDAPQNESVWGEYTACGSLS